MKWKKQQKVTLLTLWLSFMASGERISNIPTTRPSVPSKQTVGGGGAISSTSSGCGCCRVVAVGPLVLQVFDFRARIERDKTGKAGITKLVDRMKRD